jgi:hypothetical protein
MRAARGLRDPGLCASPQGHDWVDDCAYAPPRCLAAWCTQVSCGAHLRCACVVPPPSLAGVAGDVLAVVGRVCSSPLAPSSLVRFSATCRYVRTVLRPVVEELQALHAMVRVLCTKIGMRPADLGKATELNAAFKRLDYADVAVLVTLANSGSMANLNELFLGYNKIGDEGMKAFASAIANGSMGALTVLGLSNNQIGNAGMISLSEATGKGSMGALERLGLSCNQIGDAGLQSLAGAIGNGSMGKLERLNLARNNISDVGMAGFSRAIASGSLRSLEVLNLRNNQIGDAGMIEFSRQIPIGSMGALEILNLSRNQIGDAGLQALAGAIGKLSPLPACKRIVVIGNPGNAAPLKAACEERGIDLVN